VVRVVTFLAAGVAALIAPSLAFAYGWPVKPFDRQHPIRGAFDDPRWGGTFHFGVDVSAPDGTAVYAVAPGTVFRYSDAVAVRQPDGHEFSYWHVRAVVPQHAYVTAGEEIGVIRVGFGHVHFAEFDGKTYLNPLRRGALTPFADHTVPVVGPFAVRETAAGRVQATVQAYDTPPMKPPWPWQGATWTPALIRWRLVEHGAAVVPWTVAFDANVYHSKRDFKRVYAPGTRQNFPGRAGRYVFWLTHGLDLADGRYDIEVRASDTRGNSGFGSFAFDVDQSLKTTKLSSR
jgi:Peptidase family M23